MHPFILPHLMGGCVKHRVKRSVIFDAAGTRRATRTFPTAGNLKAWTWCALIKRTTLGVQQQIFSAYTSIENQGLIGFTAGDQLIHVQKVGNVNVGSHTTNRVFRDPTAFIPLVVNWDSANPTTADRMRVYIGLTREVAFNTVIAAPLNQDSYINRNLAHDLGRFGSAGQYFSGLLSEVYFIDGLALGPENFFKVDPRSGSIVPIPYTGDVGVNGFYIPFIGDAGDAPASAAEGFKDRAPITGAHIGANNFTPTNIAVTDFVKDTPTNYRNGSDYRGNFATLNPLAQFGSLQTEQGGLIGGLDATGSNRWILGTMALPTSGKYVFEARTLPRGVSQAGAEVGIVSSRLVLSNVGANSVNVPAAWYSDNLSASLTRDGATTTTYAADLVTAPGLNKWVMVCVDLDVNQISYKKDGVQSALRPLPLLPSGDRWMPFMNVNGDWVEFNFGQRSFTNAPPDGFKPLVTSALPRPSIIKPSAAFARATDTGANIQATLAALRSGWGAYIEIFKRRNGAAEGWRWRFSDDVANYLDSSTALNGKQALPALDAGSNYVGYALRVGAAYGIATGEVAHVNGVATTVNDNLGTTRKVIILRRSDAGGNWPVYHPDATSGELLYLNSDAGDAAATDIANVQASSFQIGSGMASGTYRYIVLSDISGLIDIGGFTANGSADGPFLPHEFSPGLCVFKRTDSSANWACLDAARNAANPADAALFLNATDVEATGSLYTTDFTAVGTKVRTNGGTINNTAGAKYVYIAIAAFAFAPGECPAQATAR